VNASRTSLALGICLWLSACSAVTTVHTRQAGTTVSINEKTLTEASPSARIRDTTFGSCFFKAEKAGGDPRVACRTAKQARVLPLVVRPGHIVADVLLFAPALFFNLRTVFPYYEFDFDGRVVRYKRKQKDPWTEYQPLPEEVDWAKAYFATTSAAK